MINEIGDNFTAVADALDLSIDDLAELATNSFEGSFLKPEETSGILAEIEALRQAA